jgi:hypothetical protein
LNNNDGGFGKRFKHEGGITHQSYSPTSSLTPAQKKAWDDVMENFNRKRTESNRLKNISRDNLGGTGDAADGLLRGRSRSHN